MVIFNSYVKLPEGILQMPNMIPSQQKLDPFSFVAPFAGFNCSIAAITNNQDEVVLA
jgi:hypothetical protein